ncbi:MAG: type I methionyl aminopeptidase [Parcubacteria group bacterium CG2_30_36_18]|uniref:Methionine aminopeptidase n=3 Tax=Candidatus Nealsoniibacteriota TaxID=1817911 RepID=A0A2M8DLC7_9BACT|nr:MAG: type I methionyl aminopeptidase [Parcubacteria group bacterium CG2_30_36_18]PIX88413.1 MAG: type I methionyl aminopeptidase [Candidatus Nealsonbacteria bacterium CG_4_10_14_3_um_filter_36_16]PJB98567.1 MAG: type I methionyl aminopeptidase [Candidatus Nealsonbacteria bacterium CG_4_9_14_0_8_um_filter_36_17]
MISIKSPAEIEIMVEGGKLLAKIMKELEKKVRPGITTKELDRLAESLISCPPKPWAAEDKIRCSFKGYKSTDGETVRPYPFCLCTSIDEEIVHGVPSNRVLKEGDIISLDLGIFYNGFHTDMAITVPVGKISPEAQRLIRVTKKALKRGIKKSRIGNTFGDIGNTIQRYVESQGFNVVRELCGHGIGRELHEDPKILNYGKRRTGEEIKEGMVFCIEPMVTVGDWHIKRSKNGYGYETIDNFLSAHFEHTIAITKEGPQILTTP